MEKKETTPHRAARRSYEECNKDKRKQTNGNFGTMIPRDLFENNFLDKKIIRNYDEDTYLYIKGNYEPIISEE